MQYLHRSAFALVGLSLLFLLTRCDNDSQDFVIGSDDVLMLTTPAAGVEDRACANFDKTRTFVLAPQDSQFVSWSEGRSLPDDTLQILRFEVLRDTGSISKFTLTFRPLKDRPNEVQCMKGFGCTPPWEHFPWKSPAGEFLDQTVFKYKVIPRGRTGVSFQNYHPGTPITVRVNPAI